MSFPIVQEQWFFLVFWLKKISLVHFHNLILNFSGARNDKGEHIPMSVSVGDKVLLPEYGGTKIEIESKEYTILRESDIVAKFGKEWKKTESILKRQFFTPIFRRDSATEAQGCLSVSNHGEGYKEMFLHLYSFWSHIVSLHSWTYRKIHSIFTLHLDLKYFCTLLSS